MGTYQPSCSPYCNCSRRQVFVYESGTFAANAAKYAAGDVIDVLVNKDDTVSYRVNGATVYISGARVKYPLHVDLSIFDTSTAVSQVHTIVVKPA